MSGKSLGASGQNDSEAKAVPSDVVLTQVELETLRVLRTHKVGPVKSSTCLAFNEVVAKDNLPKAHAVRSQYFDEDLAKDLGSTPYAYEVPQISTFAPIYDDMKPAILKNQNDNLPPSPSYCEVTAVGSEVGVDRLSTMINLLTQLKKFIGIDEYNKFLQFCQARLGVSDCEGLLKQQLDNKAAGKSIGDTSSGTAMSNQSITALKTALEEASRSLENVRTALDAFNENDLKTAIAQQSVTALITAKDIPSLEQLATAVDWPSERTACDSASVVSEVTAIGSMSDVRLATAVENQ